MKAEIQAETVPAPRRGSLTTRYFQQFADRSFEHQYRKESFEAGHKWLRFAFSLVVSIVVNLNIITGHMLHPTKSSSLDSSVTDMR